MWDRGVVALSSWTDRHGYSSEGRVCCQHSVPSGPAATPLVWFPCLCQRRCLILSSGTSPQHFHCTCLSMTRRLQLRQTGCPAPPGHWRAALSLTLPLRPLPHSFFGVRGIPGAGKTQILTVPHQQLCGLCTLGVADALSPLGLVIWSHGGPTHGLRPCHAYGLQTGKPKWE